MGRSFSNFWALRLSGAELPDTQSGFRVYPIRPVLDLPLRCRSYDWEVEVLVRAGWAGLDLRSVPIDVYYPPPEERVSHFRALVDNCRITVAYARLAALRLMPSRPDWRTARGADRPRIRLRDSWNTLRHLLRDGGRPAELALAISIGAFIGATPLWGAHAVLSIYVCLRLHLNPVAAFVGSNVSLPFIAPYLVYLSVQCGHRMLRGGFVEISPSALDAGELPQYMLDYVVGSFPVAFVLAVACGLLTLAAARGFRAARGEP